MVHFPNRRNALPLSTSAALSWVKLFLKLGKKEGRDGDCFAKSSRFWCRRVKMGSERHRARNPYSVLREFLVSSQQNGGRIMRGQCPTAACNILLASLYRYIYCLMAKTQCLRYKVLEFATQPRLRLRFLSSFRSPEGSRNFRGCLETN